MIQKSGGVAIETYSFWNIEFVCNQCSPFLLVWHLCSPLAKFCFWWMFIQRRCIFGWESSCLTWLWKGQSWCLFWHFSYLVRYSIFGWIWCWLESRCVHVLAFISSSYDLVENVYWMLNFWVDWILCSFLVEMGQSFRASLIVWTFFILLFLGLLLVLHFSISFTSFYFCLSLHLIFLFLDISPFLFQFWIWLRIFCFSGCGEEIWSGLLHVFMQRDFFHPTNEIWMSFLPWNTSIKSFEVL